MDEKKRGRSRMKGGGEKEEWEGKKEKGEGIIWRK